ncbi:MAG: hypothetical protein EXS31_15350 [Pedosphaera sp.]|nr:hypothetical protein [Pedosphaera sp.]
MASVPSKAAAASNPLAQLVPFLNRPLGVEFQFSATLESELLRAVRTYFDTDETPTIEELSIVLTPEGPVFEDEFFPPPIFSADEDEWTLTSLSMRCSTKAEFR